MPGCIGVKPNGELCKGVATRGSDYCPAHDPARKEARRKSASKAARSKRPHREVADVKEQVAELIRLVREKEMDRADAIACGQLYNIILRGVSLQLQIREAEEFSERLSEIEEILDLED